MKRKPASWILSLASAFVIGSFVIPVPSAAATITWTDWTTATAGSPGAGSGSMTLASTINVNYAGQTIGLLVKTPSWLPTTTFSGGEVSNAPPQTFNSIGLTGGTAATNGLSFSAPVTNPVLAIWSLGGPGNPASFVFPSSEPFALQAGGPSAEYAGSSLKVSGSTVSGSEADGVIEFSGTYSALTWTNPGFEDYYAFTVGIAGAGTPAATPEPAYLWLVGMGLLGTALAIQKLGTDGL